MSLLSTIVLLVSLAVHPSAYVVLEKSAYSPIESIGMINFGEGQWEPSQKDIQVAFEAIKLSLEHSELKSKSLILESFDSYKFQLVGYHRNTNRYIHINAFCESQDTWKKSYVFVLDGGACYWQLEYNQTLNIIESLEINGQA